MASPWSLCHPLGQLPLLQIQSTTCLAYRIYRPLHQRLLHSTPTCSARKPTRAVLKPVSDRLSTRNKSRQGPGAVREQQKETVKAAAKEQQRHTEPSKPFMEAAARLQYEQSMKASEKSTEHTIPTIRREPVTTLMPRSNSQFTSRPAGAHAMLRELAEAPTPTLLYEATKPGSYVLTCLISCMGLALLANLLFSYYLSDMSQGKSVSAGIVAFSGLMWTSLAIYAAWGPVGLVRRIYALPTTNPTKKVPTLRVEPFQFVPGRYPKPFEVPVGGAYRDRALTGPIITYDALRPVRRAPGIMDPFFKKVETIYTANLKMIARTPSFASIRIPGNSFVGRIDLRDCKALGNGQALDNLLLDDVLGPSIFKRMFGRT